MALVIEGALLSGCYRVGAMIGSGGMSVVHEARDLRLARSVALKFPIGNDARGLSERLFREARAAARVNHPAIVTVFAHESDEPSGLDYIVMERLYGEDLGTRLARSRSLLAAEVWELGCSIADVLMAVHDAGLVHRDLKPTNVFFATYPRRSDQLKLLDFGLVKQLDLPTLTHTGEALGTAAYMAPEQILDSKRVDPRSDFYALGVLLFECLSGALPHRTQTVEDLARRVLTETEPQLAVDDASAGLATIIRRCLRRSPADRYPNARALHDALRAAKPPG
jgi:eukaryotic-like serine/threonine-protein kinase